MTFKEYADEWLLLKKQDVGESQYIAYKCSLKHLEPLYAIEVKDIRPTDIQSIIGGLAGCNPTTHKPTAKKTLTDIRMTAKQVLQYAVDMREIDHNPADPVRIPKNAPKDSRRALTEKEREKIIKTPHQMRVAAMILLFAGLRRGEIIPLEWKDIDLENGTIYVNKAVTVTHNKPNVKPPKTLSGTRYVQIPKILKDYLSKEHDRQVLIYKNPKLVISEKMMSAQMWRYRWEKYMEYLNMPDVTAHMLRHTACTMMIESGMDVSSVKNQMGHSDIQTTLSIYTHITQQHQKNEVSKLDAYLANSKIENMQKIS